MKTKVSLNEASTYLGVSKQTLRNWDKSGKLKPLRDPKSRYRVYNLEELKQIKEEVAIYEVQSSDTERFAAALPTEDRNKQGDHGQSVKRLLARLHNIIRDSYANSSIIERFDELSKLLFLRALSEQKRLPEDLFNQLLESTQDYAARLRKSYRQACDEYAALVPHDFREIKLSDTALEQCGRLLDNMLVVGTDFDFKGLAFEEVIRNTFDKGDNQQFFTPKVLTEFVVQLIGERLEGVICDPACGTGGFLVEVLKQRIRPSRLTGFEIDRRLAWTSGLNLLIHGGNSFEIRQLDGTGALSPTARRFKRAFNVILSNPPFGSELSDQASLNEFVLGRGYSSRRRGILFIERCLEMLTQNGILAIVIDDGVLSLPSASDVREFLLNNYQIVAVISLPESAFLPYANVSTSILLIKNCKPVSHQHTFFAKADNVGRKANGDPDYSYDPSGKRVLNNDLPDILEAWKLFSATGRIDRDSEQVYSTDLAASANAKENRIDYLFHHPSRFDALLLLEKSRNPVRSLFELCAERNESLIPSTEATTPTLPFTGLAHIESYSGQAVQVDTPAASLKSAVKRYHPGDILFARMRPNLRKVHLAKFPMAGFTSAECVVLRPLEDDSGAAIIDPELLVIILRSDLVYGQIIHRVAGIGRPRLSVKDLRQVKIPVPPRIKQADLLEAYNAQCSAASEMRQRAQALVAEADSLVQNAADAITKALSQ